MMVAQRHLRACTCERSLWMRESLVRSLIRAALSLNALLRDKHEGLNRGNADPPVTW